MSHQGLQDLQLLLQQINCIANVSHFCCTAWAEASTDFHLLLETAKQASFAPVSLIESCSGSVQVSVQIVAD
jgi:hypothetical protein